MSQEAALRASQAANTAAAIQTGGEVASLAVTTITGIGDTNLQRKFSQNLATLSLEQQDAFQSTCPPLVSNFSDDSRN